MDQNVKRNIILENYEHPKNRGLIEDETYLCSNPSNDSCIDEIDLMVKIEKGKITDIRFDGEACAICISSASIMSDMLIGKTEEEANLICQNFESMIEGKEYDREVLGQALVYEDISHQPNRKKCSLLPWWGIKKIITKN